jgi:hypothetical protein
MGYFKERLEHARVQAQGFLPVASADQLRCLPAQHGLEKEGAPQRVEAVGSGLAGSRAGVGAEDVEVAADRRPRGA